MVCISQRFVPYPVSFSKPPGTLQCKPRFYNHTRYDAWNRLVEVKHGQTIIARYEYDGLNRRIKSHIDSGAPSNPTGIDGYLHYYYNSSWQILETRQSDTPSAQPETLQPKHQYVWSQRYIDAPVLRDENTGVNGLCDDQRLYYLNDANFNVTALLDTAGDALERYVYSPYGVLTIYDATWTNPRTTSTYANVTLYTGRELDTETGLYYYRNRYYDAELGRFVSRDPIEYGDRDASLYRYSDDVPVTRTDPTGMMSWLEWLWPPNWWRPPPSTDPPVTYRPEPKPPRVPCAEYYADVKWAKIQKEHETDKVRCAALKLAMSKAKAAGRGKYAEALMKIYTKQCFKSGMP